MNAFDKFCNLVLETYGARVDVPNDGRSAPDRYNNPGGAYPSQKFEKYGLEGYGVIGGGQPIGKYPSLANGIAANIAHLKSMPVIGKKVSEARYYWINGNMGGTQALIGMDNNQVITPELLNDPNWLAQWMKATAAAEGFTKSGREIDDASMQQALAILKNAGDIDPNAVYASNGKTPTGDKTEGEDEGIFDSPAAKELAKLKGYAMGLLSGNIDATSARNALKQTIAATTGAIKGALS